MKLKFWNVFLHVLLSNRGSVGEEGISSELGGESNAESNDGGSADGGESGSADSNTDNASDDSNSIYGDRAVEWPEGTEDTLKNEPSLKPFVNQDGKINTANLLKSYFHTKKMQGSNKVVLPTENSSNEEIQEFYNKIGASSDMDAYKMERSDDSHLQEDFTGALQQFAHENKLALPVAQKLNAFMEAQAKEGSAQMQNTHNEAITKGLQSVKDEMGAAYDHKLGLAKRVLKDMGDDELAGAFKDPALGSNPAVLKTLMKIGEKLYKEDGFSGKDNANSSYSPEEAQDKINDILGDPEHAYHKSSHPSNAKAQKDMLKLFEMKNAIRK